MKRLFLGTFLSDEAQLAFAASQKTKQFSNRNLSNSGFSYEPRWVKPEKLHLTWLFLGDLPEERLELLACELARVLDSLRNCSTAETLATAAFTYDQAEIWFKRGEPRLLVLTPSQPPPPTLQLINQIRQRLLAFVEEPHQAQAQAEWLPHISIARLAQRNSQPVGNGQHPLHPDKRLRRKVLPVDALEPLPLVCPVSHNLLYVAMIESKTVGDAHGYSHKYSIVRSFNLA